MHVLHFKCRSAPSSRNKGGWLLSATEAKRIRRFATGKVGINTSGDWLLGEIHVLITRPIRDPQIIKLMVFSSSTTRLIICVQSDDNETQTRAQVHVSLTQRHNETRCSEYSYYTWRSGVHFVTCNVPYRWSLSMEQKWRFRASFFSVYIEPCKSQIEK